MHPLVPHSMVPMMCRRKNGQCNFSIQLLVNNMMTEPNLLHLFEICIFFVASESSLTYTTPEHMS